MNKAIYLLILIFYTSTVFGDGVTVTIVKGKSLKITPGTNVTLPLRIDNGGKSIVNCRISTLLPQGWHTIADEKAFSLEPGGSIVKLINAQVPRKADAREYNLKVSLLDQLTGVEYSSTSILLEVNEKIEIDMNLLEVPDYVQSGEQVTAKVLLKSNSNKDVTVRLVPRNCKLLQPESFILSPGDSRMAEVSFRPLAEANTVNSHSFGVAAMVSGNDSTQFSASDYVDVIPVEYAPADNRFKYPVALKGSYLTRYFEDGYKYAVQGEAYGSGMLGEGSENYLEFRFRGPNTYSLSSLGKVDQYYVKFRNEKIAAVAGDDSYSVTPLSEPGRYARGAGIQLKAGEAKVSAFYAQPRFYPDVKQIFSGSAEYKIRKKYTLGLHYLAKDFSESDELAHIISFTALAEPVKYTRLLVEYSRSQHAGNEGNGVYTSLTSRFWKINLSGYFIYADKYYSGYYNNTLSFIANMSINLFKGFSLTANFQRDERNAARDTLFATAPFTISYRGGFNWQLSKLTILRGYGGYRQREDRMPDKKFNYEENFAKLEFNQVIRKFTLNLLGEAAITTNLLLQQNNVAPSYGVFADLGYRPADNINISAFVSYSYDNRYSEASTSNIFYGGSLDAWFTKNTHLYLRFQNAYALEEYYRDRSFFTLMFSQIFARKHEVSVVGQYGMMQKELKNNDLAVELSYTYYLGVPLGKKKVKSGSVKGKINNLGVNSVEGIILHLNAYTAVTDKEGFFNFGQVVPGTYYLVMDGTSVDFEDVTDRPVPLRVEVLDKHNAFIELGLTKGAVIEGQIEMGEDETLPVGLSKMVIELDNGRENIKTVTNEKQAFRFSGIRPGKWKVILHSESLPGSYYFKENNFTVELKPGEKLILPVKLYKKERVIKLKKNNFKVVN